MYAALTEKADWLEMVPTDIVQSPLDPSRICKTAHFYVNKEDWSGILWKPICTVVCISKIFTIKRIVANLMLVWVSVRLLLILFLNGLAFPVYWPLKATSQRLSTCSAIYTHICTVMAEAAMQVANCSSGAIWGSVSGSGILQHAARRSWDSNQWPSDY